MKAFKGFVAGICMLLVGSQVHGQAAIAPALEPVTVSQPATASPSAPAGQAQTLSKADADAWLDGYMPYALRSADIPGAVVVIVKDGKIVTARGFGYADLDKHTPVDPDKTLFRAGSVSKLFTWTAAMQLVQAGKLDLDRDVNAYLDFRIPPRHGQPITLRQLMTHTGGFEETAKSILTYRPSNQPELAAYVKRWTPARIFDAGTTPAYSNWGTALTGYIIQRVSGEPFNDYIDHHILAPLGMKNASFRQPLPANLLPQMATGYAEPGKPAGFEFVGPAPAGALSISGTDMARFMIMHLANGSFGGQQILRPDMAAMMHDSPLAKVDPRSLIPPLNRMELGFFETNINGREVIGHLGDSEAFHTSLHLFLKDNAGLFVSFNSPGKAAAVQALRTALFEDFADRYFPNIAPPDGRVDAQTAKAHAALMAGDWIASRRADTTWLASVYWLASQAKVMTGPKGELVVPALLGAGGRPREWIEIAPFVWRDAHGHELLAAKLANGKVIRWSFGLAAPFEVFDRVPASMAQSWLIPAYLIAIGILLITLLHWIGSAAARRRYRAQPALLGRAAGVRRGMRIMAAASLALQAGWAWVALVATKDYEMLAGGLDPILPVLQIAGMFVFFGGVLVSGWNLVMAWRDGRHWTRKLWGVAVFAAALVVLYIALQTHLMTPGVNF